MYFLFILRLAAGLWLVVGKGRGLLSLVILSLGSYLWRTDSATCPFSSPTLRSFWPAPRIDLGTKLHVCLGCVKALLLAEAFI